MGIMVSVGVFRSRVLCVVVALRFEASRILFTFGLRTSDAPKRNVFPQHCHVA